MRILSIYCLLMLTACATGSNTGPGDGTTQANAGEQVAEATKLRQICSREKPTGSHRSIVTCRTVTQMEKDKESARALMNQRGSMTQESGISQ